MKYHVALIISKSPIKLPKKLSKDESVQHLITTEFEMGKDILDGLGDDDRRIEKSAPEYCRGITTLFDGKGSSISVAITDWLRNLCSSVSYEPFYFRFRKD